MRVLAVIALAMLLAGCEGDPIEQSETAPVIVATVQCLRI
jgi:PBP1b-binding outer membrane lipoprotein LpoB